MALPEYKPLAIKFASSAGTNGDEVLAPRKGYETIVSTIKMYVEYPLWAGIISFGISAIFLLFAIGLSGILAAFIIGLITFFVTLSAVIGWTVTIPSNPPTIGIPTWFGRWEDKVVSPGPFVKIPKIKDVIQIEMTRVDQDFNVQNVFTKDNASVIVKGHIAWQPDSKRPHMFLRSAGSGTKEERSKRIKEILDNMFPEYLRSEIKKMETEDALRSSEDLTDKITESLVGYNADKDYMKTIGLSDIKGIGICPFICNVSEIIPSPGTVESIEQKIREKYQRLGEVYEMETRAKQSLAKIFAKKGLSYSNLEDKVAKGEMKEEDLESKVKEIRSENPEMFDREFDDLFTANIEYEAARKSPGSLTPGLRERLRRDDASLIDSILSSVLASSFKKK